MKLLLNAIVGIALFGLSTSFAFSAKKPIVHVSLLTAPFGTGSYVLGAALQDISNKANLGVRVDSSESPGFLYNIKELASSAQARKTTIVGSDKEVLALATAGKGPFHKKYPGLKLICAYQLFSPWLATLDPKIRTVRDLVGKRLALGRTTQIGWAVMPEDVLRTGWGLNLHKIDISFLGPKEAVAALLDGHVDAAIVGGYIGAGHHPRVILSPQTLQFMASGRSNLHFISWGKEEVKKTIANGLQVIPIVLPPNAIPGVKRDFPIFADAAGWFVSSAFPRHAAYEVTKMIIDNVGKFAEYHALGKLMSRRALVYGFSESEIAPGALEAYREAGILK